MTAIGERLKEVRKERRMSQAELARKVGLRQASISDLESGKTRGTASIAKIASALNVSAMWLETGRGDKEPVQLDNNVTPVDMHSGYVPVISWVNAGEWRTALDDRATYEHVPCPTKKHGRGTFALYVRGISMYNPSGRHSFSDGDLIFVDPSREAMNGDYIIAMHNDLYEATFKQLIVEDNKMFLHALNPSWSPQIQEINKDTFVVGVVIAKQTNESFV